MNTNQNSNNSNNQVTDDFFIPAMGGQKEKRKDIKLLSIGPNPCILFGLIQLGTQKESFQNSEPKDVNKLLLLFEFPLLKQKFYVEDTEDKTSIISIEVSNYITEKSNLAKLISGMLGRPLTKEEYKTGVKNIASFVGKSFICDIENKTSKAGNLRQEIIKTSLKPINEQIKSVYNFNWDEIKQYNESILFSIANPEKAFTGETFTKLYGWIRNKIKDSVEGKEFAAKGGVFAQYKDFNTEANNAQSNGQANDNNDVFGDLTDDIV